MCKHQRQEQAIVPNCFREYKNIFSEPHTNNKRKSNLLILIPQAFLANNLQIPTVSFFPPSSYPPDEDSITLNQSFPGWGNSFFKYGCLLILSQFSVSAPISITSLLHLHSPPQSSPPLISSLISHAFPKERSSADVYPLFAVWA